MERVVNWYKKYSYFIANTKAYYIDGSNKITRVEYDHIYDILNNYDLHDDIQSQFEGMFGEKINWEKDSETVTEFVKDFMLEHHIFNVVVDIKDKQVYVRPNLGEKPSYSQIKALSDWAIENGWNEDIKIDVVIA